MKNQSNLEIDIVSKIYLLEHKQEIYDKSIDELLKEMKINNVHILSVITEIENLKNNFKNMECSVTGLVKESYIQKGKSQALAPFKKVFVDYLIKFVVVAITSAITTSVIFSSCNNINGF